MADNPRIEELRRRVDSDPASIAFAQLAEEYRRAGCFEDAVRVCRAGLERHPSYLSARVTLGRALLELQEYEDARSELEHVLRSAPENLAAIRGLAEIHQRRGDLSEALRQYQAALGIARHDPDLEESVHDLSRQLGGPLPAAPAAGPPQAATALPDPGAWSAEPQPGDPGEPEALAMGTSLSPELEAAADEFTRALQALDALRVVLPGPPAADSTPPAPAAWTVPADPPAMEPPPPEIPGGLAADAPPEGGEEPGGRPVAKVVTELEAWLDAIVLDRSERAASPGEPGHPEQSTTLPDLPDLPLEIP